MPETAAAAFVFRPTCARWRRGRRGIAEEFPHGHAAMSVWRLGSMIADAFLSNAGYDEASAEAAAASADTSAAEGGDFGGADSGFGDGGTFGDFGGDVGGFGDFGGGDL